MTTTTRTVSLSQTLRLFVCFGAADGRRAATTTFCFCMRFDTTDRLVSPTKSTSRKELCTASQLLFVRHENLELFVVLDTTSTHNSIVFVSVEHHVVYTCFIFIHRSCCCLQVQGLALLSSLL